MRLYLRELRSKKKLSQQDVATKLNITRQYYCSIENGERQKDMDITLVSKLADVFKVSPQKIMSEELKNNVTNQ